LTERRWAAFSGRSNGPAANVIGEFAVDDPYIPLLDDPADRRSMTRDVAHKPMQTVAVRRRGELLDQLAVL
jgi:hypothetical protein